MHHTKLNQTLYHYGKQKQKLQVQSKQTSNISLREKKPEKRNSQIFFFTTLKLCVPWLWCRLQVTSVERRCTMCVWFLLFFFVCLNVFFLTILLRHGKSNLFIYYMYLQYKANIFHFGNYVFISYTIKAKIKSACVNLWEKKNVFHFGCLVACLIRSAWFM